MKKWKVIFLDEDVDPEYNFEDSKQLTEALINHLSEIGLIVESVEEIKENETSTTK